MKQEKYGNEQIKPIFEEIDRLLAADERPVTVAIDGCSCSGKTTLGNRVAGHYDCNLFHMDDFFLRKEQRTPERYAQPGGNVDYERFHEEVLVPILEGRDCLYRKFDCGTFTLGEPVRIAWKRLNIVEGSYSQHPFFGDCYQLRVFLNLSEEEQRRRIFARDPRKAERFLKEWIPMENKYFKAYAIRDKSIVI